MEILCGVVHLKKRTAGWSWTPLNKSRIYTYLDMHHYNFICLDTPHMPWFTTLHPLYASVHTTPHLMRLGTHSTYLATHHICPCTQHYTLYMSWYTPLRTICLGTHYYTFYMPWYTQLYTLHYGYMPWYIPLHTF